MLICFHDLLSPEEMKAYSSASVKITFNYKLFQKHHLADIQKLPLSSLPHAKFSSSDAPVVPPMSADIRKLLALSVMDEIKNLEMVIATSQERKKLLEEALAKNVVWCIFFKFSLILFFFYLFSAMFVKIFSFSLLNYWSVIFFYVFFLLFLCLEKKGEYIVTLIL